MVLAKSVWRLEGYVETSKDISPTVGVLFQLKLNITMSLRLRSMAGTPTHGKMEEKIKFAPDPGSTWFYATEKFATYKVMISASLCGTSSLIKSWSEKKIRLSACREND